MIPSFSHIIWSTIVNEVLIKLIIQETIYLCMSLRWNILFQCTNPQPFESNRMEMHSSAIFPLIRNRVTSWEVKSLISGLQLNICILSIPREKLRNLIDFLEIAKFVCFLYLDKSYGIFKRIQILSIGWVLWIQICLPQAGKILL